MAAETLNEQHPGTLKVIDKRFDGDVMIIRKDDFNSKYHTRVNDQGQEVDERGVVVEKPAKPAKDDGKTNGQGPAK